MMWPLPAGLLSRLGVYAVAALALWVFGFTVGMNRGNIKIEKAKTAALIIQRTESEKLAKSINDSRVKNEKALSDIIAANDLLISRLSNRPYRYLPGAAPAGRTCEAATGPELSREDAMFLTGLASDALQYVNALNGCKDENKILRAAMEKR